MNHYAEEAEDDGGQHEEEDACALARRRWAGVRRTARSRVQGPGFMLVLAGIATILAVLGLVVLVSAVVDPVLNGLVAALGLVVGTVMIVAGHRMRQLRSYALAMIATWLVFVAALWCAPLGLLAVWPLIVLLDADVKCAFRNQQLPDESS